MINWILKKYWLSKCTRLAKAKGVTHWHVTPAEGAKDWEVFKEFFAHLQQPIEQGLSVEQFAMWEEWASSEQDRLKEAYKKIYGLTDAQIGTLHMSFSPYKIPQALTMQEIRKRIT